MFSIVHILVSLLASSTIVAANTNNYFAGVWAFTAITRTFPNGTVVEPIGPNPYGRLHFTRGLNFAAQINVGNYSAESWPQTPGFFEAGTAAQNARIATQTLALSGVYQVDTAGTSITALDRRGGSIPNFIGLVTGPPVQVFQLIQGGQKMIETVQQTDNSTYRFFYDRVEVS